MEHNLEAFRAIQYRAQLAGLEVKPVERDAFAVLHRNEDGEPIVIYKTTNLEHVAAFVRGYAS